ncbi:MAG: 2'-5' RNA ligase [Halanaerobiales bacterium]|nr:2'-5' RNA ligase [Halanaerobiales bacterium]
MIKAASLKDELFIVLLPQGEVLQRASEVQQIIAEQYQVYATGNYPGIHITIDRFKRGDIRPVEEIIKEVLKKSRPIEIVLQQFACYKNTEQNNFLVLKLKETASLREFSYTLHQRLASGGFSTISDYAKWEFHITVLSNLFSDNPLPAVDFENLCLSLAGEKYPCSARAERLEIWSPDPNPAKRCIKGFKLEQ